MSEFNNPQHPSAWNQQTPPAQQEWWGPQNPSLEHTVQPDVRSTPQWRKFAAGAALMGTLAAGAFAATEALGPDKSEPRVTQNVEAQKIEAAPRVPLDLETVQSDFAKALSGDVCAVKVTTAEATDVYSKLFGGTVLSKIELKDLSAESDAVKRNLEANRQKLEFIPLPKEQYNLLLNDAWSKSPQTNVSEYRSLLDGYAAKFGLTTLYGWEKSSNKFDSKLPVVSFIDPMSPQELENSPNAKKAIIGAVQDLSLLPTSAISESHKKRLVFGNIRQDGVLGGVTDNTDVYIDAFTNKEEPIDPRDGSKENQITLSHELGHGLEKSVCGLVAFLGINRNDKAYTALNKNYQYGEVGQKQIADGTYTSLETINNSADQQASGELAVVRDYSNTNESEDKATVLGEHILNSEKAYELYDGPESTSILREKVALIIARIAKKNPAMGEYYISLMQTARIQNELRKRESMKFDAMDQLLFAPDSIKTTNDIVASPEYQALKIEADKFRLINDTLQKTIVG